MPCLDPYAPYDTIAAQQRQLDLVTRLLCAWCTHPEQMPREVKEWWLQHQRNDARRKAEEAAMRLARKKRLIREHAQALRELESEL